jgi:hypothetical protein
MFAAFGIITLTRTRAATPQHGFYGVNAHPMWQDTPIQDRSMDAMQRAGVQSVRIDAQWSYLEPSAKGTYNDTYLQRLDYAVSGLAARGIEPSIVVTSAPTWASGNANRITPPQNVQDYDDFLAMLMRRWAGKVKTYEVWNEPDGSWAWATPDAARYTVLLKSAYTAAKAVDPHVTILGGSLFSSRDQRSIDFLKGMYANGAKSYFDVLSQHYYGDPPNHGNAANTPESIADDYIKNIVPIMQANGDSAKRTWVTETGSNTSTTGVSEATQAELLTRSYVKTISIPNVDRLYAYDWIDDGTTVDPENHYGLLDTTLREKPAYAAFQKLGLAAVAKDLTPPTVPTSPSAIAVSPDRVNLSWKAATDNVAVASYSISRNGVFLQTTTTTTLADTTTKGNTSYTYTIVALDASGNTSAQATVKVSTPAPLETTVGSTTGFVGAYFANKTLAGAAIYRADPTINFSWAGAPLSGIPADGFSARWTGRLVAPASGTFTFTTTSDDAVRLWVGTTLLVDHWANHGTAADSKTISLTAGASYNIRMEYFDQSGTGVAKLAWKGPGIATATTIPASVMHTDSNGLSATYFKNTTLTGAPALTRLDPNVDYSWGTSATPSSLVGTDNFSIRWTGKLLPVATGVHTFTVNANDGVRLWVGNQLLIDSWKNQAVTNQTGTITLTAGTSYPIRLEYYDQKHPAAAHLYWSYPGAAKVAIPTTRLFDR